MTRSGRVLAIESSCDETAAAVTEGLRVCSSVVASQIEVHAPFGGVVPELASRHHLGSVVPVVHRALEEARIGLDEVEAFAVTEGPGLVGALLVGIGVARGLAAATNKPLFGIHHMEGHLFSAFLDDPAASELEPHLALLVSGGHTELVEVEGLGRYRLLGATRDDAVGEAFDKVAKLLGLGYPGGPVIDRLAAQGRPDAIAFPRAMIDQDNLDFSFAGLKTAVLVHIDRHGQPTSASALADVCASFQAAAVDVLVAKTLRAREEVTGASARTLVVVGGAAANRALRARLHAASEAHGFALRAAPLRYCGDNAAMIGAAAGARMAAGARPAVALHTSDPLDDPRLRL